MSDTPERLKRKKVFVLDYISAEEHIKQTYEQRKDKPINDLISFGLRKSVESDHKPLILSVSIFNLLKKVHLNRGGLMTLEHGCQIIGNPNDEHRKSIMKISEANSIKYETYMVTDDLGLIKESKEWGCEGVKFLNVTEAIEILESKI